MNVNFVLFYLLCVIYYFESQSIRAVTNQNDSFPGQPAYRQHDATHHRVVVIRIVVPTRSEVRYLYAITISNEAVTCSEVSVDDIQGLKVFHTRRNLCRHVHETAVTVQGENYSKNMRRN